jgi:RHS repeat-associated protein
MPSRHVPSVLRPARRRIRVSVVVSLLLTLGVSTGVADAQATTPATAASRPAPEPPADAATAPRSGHSSLPTVSEPGRTVAASSTRPTADHAPPARPTHEGPVSATVTNPQGDSLTVSRTFAGWVSHHDGQTYYQCQYAGPVLYPGQEFVACGVISIYDANPGPNGHEYAPGTNSETHWVYDACGTLQASGSSYNWHYLNVDPPEISSGYVGSTVITVPSNVPSNCFGAWTIVWSYTQTFYDGTSLTDSVSGQEMVYSSYADFVAKTTPQQSPTGGAVGPNEQLGGCGSGHSTHGHSTKYPVDTATGNFWHTFRDLSIPGRGPAIDLTRTYNSLQAGVNGPFGYGWNDSYAASLAIQPSTVVVTQCNGSKTTFTLNGTAWTAPPRAIATLVHNADGTWSFTRGAREIYVFDATGRLTAERDRNGYTTTISYPNASTRVVTDPAGRTLTFAFTGSHVTSVTDSATPARSLTYTYDGSGNLTDVVDVGAGHWQFTYDASHRMLTMRSPRYYGDTTTTPSPVVTNHYDAQGRVDWQSDPLGRTTTFDYTSIADSTKITDPKGNVTVHKYQDGLLVFETRAYGTTSAAEWVYRYDPDTLGLVLAVDANGNRSSATYDSTGNMLMHEDARYRETYYTYNALREVTSVTEPRPVNGQSVTRSFTYDAAGNLLTESAPLLDANGATVATATTVNHYDDPAHPGDITSRTDPNGNTTTYTYDSVGDLASSTAPPTPENASGNKTTFAYNTAKGWLTSTVSPRGNVAGGNPAAYTTSYSYDAYGRLTLTKDPLWSAGTPTRHQTVKHYDADGNLDYVIDGDNHTTRFSYDAAGEQTQVQRADNSLVKTEYWPDGSLKKQIDGANQATTYDYNPRGQLQTVTDPLLRTTTYTPDGVGNILKVTNPTGYWTTMTYDANNAPVSITYSDGVTPNVTNITYDEDGQRTAMTDGTGTSTWAYDSLHRVTQTTNGAGQTVQYGYDLGGRLTSIGYPGSTGTVTRTYDAANRLASVRDWAGRTTTFSYDPDSNLVAQTYPNGTTASYTTDATHHVSAISDAPTATPNSPFASFNYGRDGASLLTSVTSTGVPSDNHTWSYNQINELTGVDSSTYGYDAADNLSQRLDGTTQAHDAAHQLNVASPAPISLVGTTSAGGSTSTSLTLTLPTGTTTSDQILLAVTMPSSKTISTPTGYTPVGTYSSGTANSSAKVAVYQRTAVAGDASVTVSFQGKFDKTATLAVYRGVSPLTPVDTTSSGAAAPGTTVTAPSINTALGGERLVWIGGASGTAGAWTIPTGMTSRVQRTSTSTDGVLADQALTTVGATGARAGTHSTSTQLVGAIVALRPAGTTFGYDLQGNRTTVTTNTGSTVTSKYDQVNRLTGYGTTATYRYNADGLRASKTVSGTTTSFTWDASPASALLSEGTANYVYGVNGLPLERIDSTGAVLYYHQDQLGSTRALTNSSGAVVKTYTYDAYGNVTASTGTATNPFRYAGEYTDDESGYQYLRARFYDPATGEFPTRDPISALTHAPYQYGGNDPLNEADPSGLNKCEVGLNPGRWIGNLTDCASKARAPDYISLDLPFVSPTGYGYDFNVTLNRDGKVYVAPGGASGLPGFAASLRAGWLNQSTIPCDSQVDKFSSGPSTTVAGTLPIFDGFGPSVGETYGFGGTATEIGVGAGFEAAESGSGNWAWKLPWQLPRLW